MRSTTSKDCKGFTSAFSCAIPEVNFEGKGFVDWKDRAMDKVSEDQLVVMYAELSGLAVNVLYFILSETTQHAQKYTQDNMLVQRQRKPQL